MTRAPSPAEMRVRSCARWTYCSRHHGMGGSAEPVPHRVKFGTEDLRLTEDEVRAEELRGEVEPWLTTLVQAEHLSLLLGSGFTTGALAVAGVAAPGMATAGGFGEFQASIDRHAEASAATMGRGGGNLEDQIRVANELIAGLTIQDDAERADACRASVRRVLSNLATDVLRAESEFRDKVNGTSAEGQKALALLQSFLLSFASRSASRERLNVFTTNYDRVVEFGCDLTGVRLLDRFVGALEPVFRTSRVDVDLHYNPPGMRGEPRYLEGVARISKLHGSVDWVWRNRIVTRVPLAFGGQVGDLPPDLDRSLMVFPNSAKDMETAAFPYAELFRDFSAAVCRPNAVLITYGYGFGDDHVNRVLRDMLAFPSTHLLAMCWKDDGARLEAFTRSVARDAQLSLLVGPKVCEFETLVTHLLPKPAIDAITQRRARLLERRTIRGVHAPAAGEEDRQNADADPA